ncbi:MAG: RNase H1/viroplasmin domain-containing protein [Clostridiales bacterium]|jgi:ribonuclease HI|nr:RNase H1/viroplasmin domain-containing protein [Clostridiales bacterium]
MVKKKVYAVRAGHRTGIFYSWSECMAAIKGYSKPDFCAFFEKEDAVAFMNAKPPSDKAEEEKKS